MEGEIQMYCQLVTNHKKTKTVKSTSSTVHGLQKLHTSRSVTTEEIVHNHYYNEQSDGPCVVRPVTLC